jgi:hypothetical protein
VRRLTLSSALLVAAGLARVAAAQDSHYWTYGYGPIGQLTEGALVGGVSDLSATYYNPAACALIDRPRFVFNVTSFDFAQIQVKDAAGSGLDVDQMVSRPVPAMLAFHIGPHEEGNHFAFAFLSRYESDFDLGYSASDVSEASAVAAAGYGRFKHRVLEYWFGGNWSRRVSRNVSIGLSPFFAFRGQRSRRSLAAEQLAPDLQRGAFVGIENEYNHMRVLAKLGVAWRPGSWQLGANLTAPGFKVYSDGKTNFNATAASGTGVTLLAATTQKGLEATYHAPWSVALGATRRFERSAVHATVEWFSAIDAYDILTPAPAPVAGRGESIPLQFRGEAASVVNFGVGFEHGLGDTLRLYGGAARNYSTYIPERDTFSPWDLTDVTAGLSVDRGRMRFALGLGYAWGTGELQQLISPPDASGTPPVRSASYHRWRISFGASFRND